MKRLLTGAAAGFAATFPMTAVMETLHRRLPGESPAPLPPREVTDGAANRAGVDGHLSEDELQLLTVAAHFGYGTLCGAIFGLIAPRDSAAAVASGLVFGLGVWGASYLGLLPGVGVRHHARHDTAARNAMMIAAHLVWGAAAGSITAAALGEDGR